MLTFFYRTLLLFKQGYGSMEERISGGIISKRGGDGNKQKEKAPGMIPGPLPTLPVVGDEKLLNRGYGTLIECLKRILGFTL
jgi:hypothetical protein